MADSSPSSFFRFCSAWNTFALAAPTERAERVGNLLMRVLLIDAQDQRRPLLARQLRDRRPDAHCALVAQQPIGGRLAGACRRAAVSSIGSFFGVFTASRFRQALTRNAIQPRGRAPRCP